MLFTWLRRSAPLSLKLKSSSLSRIRTFKPRLEELEDRTTPSVNPSARELYMLELVNRLRMNPAAELPMLVNSTDQNVQNALAFFGVNQQVLAQQWSQLTAAAPLALNADLEATSLAHNQLMLQFQQQSHQLPGEASLGQRLTNAGYDWIAAGENIYAYANDPFYGYAGFAIDWGPVANGIQNPAGHRINLMNSGYAEVGISILDAPSGSTVGPELITQDFGNRSSLVNPYLLGAVFNDANANNFYEVGEGIGNVTVSATDGTNVYTTTTGPAGGYQLQLAAGNYMITYSGGALANPLTRYVTMGSSNVEVDVNPAAPSSSPVAAGQLRSLVTSRDGAGNPEVFGIDPYQSQVYGLRFDSNNHAVGGYFLASPGQVQSIVVGRTASGNPELFAIDPYQNQVYYLKFDANGNPVGNFRLASTGHVQSINVGAAPNGDLVLFAVDPYQGQVYVMKFDANGDPAGNFGLAAPGHVKSIVLGHDANNNPELFAIDPYQSQVYALRFDASANPIGGFFLAAAGNVQSVSVGNDANGNPELFAVDPYYGQVYALKFDANGNPVGGYFQTAGGQVQSIIVGHNANGNPEILAIDPYKGQVYDLKFDSSGAPIGGWSLVTAGRYRSIGISNDINNDPVFFGVAANDQVYMLPLS